MPEHSRGAVRQGELLRGVFKILYEEENGLRRRDVFSRLEQEIPPTEHEQEPVSHGRPTMGRYQKLTDWTTVDAKKSGWMIKENNGQWSLTDAGRQAYREFPDPLSFFQEASKWKKQPSEDSTEDSDGNLGISDSTIEDAQENAWTDIENYLAGMPPYNFQEIVAGLLEGMGHYIYWIAPPGPDGGVDIHAGTDPIGVSGNRIKVQVKRRRDSISIDPIRSFRDTLKNGDAGIFISTGGFTREAEKEARRGQRHLVLIDAVRFFELWEAHYEQIPEARRRLLPIKRISFLDLSNIPNV